MYKILIAFLVITGIGFCKQVYSQDVHGSKRVISVDVTSEKGNTIKAWRKCIGAGRANEGLRADWQEQLRQVKQDCGFEYIRMHGLLHDDMGEAIYSNTIECSIHNPCVIKFFIKQYKAKMIINKSLS